MNGGGVNGGDGGGTEEEQEEGMSVHSPCKAPPSSSSSLPKEQSQVEVELRLLEALEIYPPAKLCGKNTSSLCPLRADGIYAEKLLDRFYNLEMLKPDDEENEILQEEEFSLPQSYFAKEES